MAGYFDELARTREMLNSRYDDFKSGKVKPISQSTAKNFLKIFAVVRTNCSRSIRLNDRRAGLCPSSSRGAGHHGNLEIHRGR
jgi:hypothetical protein